MFYVLLQVQKFTRQFYSNKYKKLFLLNKPLRHLMLILSKLTLALALGALYFLEKKKLSDLLDIVIFQLLWPTGIKFFNCSGLQALNFSMEDD
jgi:hypothetical protein